MDYQIKKRLKALGYYLLIPTFGPTVYLWYLWDKYELLIVEGLEKIEKEKERQWKIDVAKQENCLLKFISLMNEYGADSIEAKNFQMRYISDRELMIRMRKAYFVEEIIRKFKKRE